MPGQPDPASNALAFLWKRGKLAFVTLSQASWLRTTSPACNSRKKTKTHGKCCCWPRWTPAPCPGHVATGASRTIHPGHVKRAAAPELGCSNGHSSLQFAFVNLLVCVNGSPGLAGGGCKILRHLALCTIHQGHVEKSFQYKKWKTQGNVFFVLYKKSCWESMASFS